MKNALLKPAIILVADRTLSGDYKILFEGIFATMQTTHVPEIAMRKLVSPPIKTDQQGRAHCAPLGIRRIESALLAQGNLTPDQIVCTTPEMLPKLMGPWVKVVGVSSSDPLGQGMSNTTTTGFWPGELYTKFWTNQMMQQIKAAKQKHNFKVIAGGAGAWQWAADYSAAKNHGIDTIFEGYGEEKGVRLIRNLLDGSPAPQHVIEDTALASAVKPIRDASMLGIIELSRGCGKGCRFCSTAHKKMEHLEIETILADLQTNVDAGITSVVSGSEDFFRYGSKSANPDYDKLHELLQAINQIKNLSFMQIDHANITSVLHLTDEQLSETRQLLTWNQPTDYLWLNMGVESANGQLVKDNCPGKLTTHPADQWESMVHQAVDKLSRTGFYPVLSIVLGLPGETLDDIKRTSQMVEKLSRKGIVIFPIFFEPVRPADIDANLRFTKEHMHLAHLDLYQQCYEINFKRVPKLYWDNQRAGGVSLAKRSLIRMLGKTEVFSWRRAFARERKRIIACPPTAASARQS